MEKQSYFLRKFAALMNIGILEIEPQRIQIFSEYTESNPIYQNAELREYMINGAKKQNAPYLSADNYGVYFACIKRANTFYVLGPFCLQYLNRVELRQFYRSYGISLEHQKQLPHFLFSEMLDIVEIIGNILLQKEYHDNELINENKLVVENREEEEKEHILYSLKKEEEELYHHTYQEERKLLDSVTKGDVDAALRYNRNLDGNIGKLSSKELNHWKNLVVVAITLCTRAAIDGGVSPFIAYQISDFYIQKSDSSIDMVQVMKYRDHAVEELTRQVKRKKERRISSYIERCEDYIGKNYKKKISLSDVADKLGISETYLSKLFKKETGMRFQDYIVEVRLDHAANLLKYSDETISNIAEYVNFPSQSYMGKIFKKKYHVTPKEYREMNRPAEFFSDSF